MQPTCRPVNDSLFELITMISACRRAGALSVTVVAPYYGYLIWLNKEGAMFKDAPRSSWFAIGAGSSITWVDPELQLVCIMRWIDTAKTNDCIGQIMRAI